MEPRTKIKPHSHDVIVPNQPSSQNVSTLLHCTLAGRRIAFLVLPTIEQACLLQGELSAQIIFLHLGTVCHGKQHFSHGNIQTIVVSLMLFIGEVNTEISGETRT